MLVAWLCPTLCDPMDCSPPGSSVHGILQAKILEWVAEETNIFLIALVKRQGGREDMRNQKEERLREFTLAYTEMLRERDREREWPPERNDMVKRNPQKEAEIIDMHREKQRERWRDTERTLARR